MVVCAEFIEAVDSSCVGSVCRGAQTLFKIELNKAVQVWENQSTCILSRRSGISAGIMVGSGSRPLACSKAGHRLLRDSASATSFSRPGRCRGI